MGRKETEKEMKDLIDRESALKGFAEYSDAWCYINALPSAQQIIYCKDCKYLDINEWCKMHLIYADKDDHCSWGKKDES